MLFKPRTKPSELMILELLKSRMTLSTKDERRLLSMSKGYEGELLFDRHFKQLQDDSLILNDLLFELNHTTFQIDSLIIFNNLVYFYEIKYFEGDYFFQADKFFKKPNREIINPALQLARSESLLKQLLLSLGYKPQIISNVIFVHPFFTLYEAPLHIPFVFPTQIKRHIEELNQHPSKITSKHMQLAEKLVELHIEESRFTKLPEYEFELLQKGLRCAECGELSIVVEGRFCSCSDCNRKATMSETILLTVKEFQLLFPDEKLTTNAIFKWCGKLISKKTIGRVLQSHFDKKGVHQWTYYE